jgi:lysophospholipase L1-like esterase
LGRGIDEANPQGPFELVSLLIGVNNQFRGRAETEYRGEFARLLERAIAFAHGDAARVLVLSIPDWGVTPFAAARDRFTIGEQIDRFNRINREEALRLGAHYVDVTPSSRRAASDASLIASDGLHPSAKMYRDWVDLALPVALEILRPS